MTKQENVTIRDVYELLAEMRDEIKSSYVTKEEFWPVRAIVYGGAGIVLIGVFGFLVSLAIKN